VSYVAMEEALAVAGFAMVYDVQAERFRPPAALATQSARSTTSLLSAHQPGQQSRLDGASTTPARLATAARLGGFLGLPMRGSHLPGAAAAIAARYPVRPVDLDAELLRILRELAAEHGQDWAKLVAVDARRSGSGRVSPGLASYLSVAWSQLRDVLSAATGGERTVLFLHDAGLLGRYHADGGRELLVELQQAARRAGQAPHGVWLLCPGDSARDTPRLGGHIVEVLGDAERVPLDRAFLDVLQEGVDSTA